MTILRNCLFVPATVIFEGRRQGCLIVLKEDNSVNSSSEF